MCPECDKRYITEVTCGSESYEYTCPQSDFLHTMVTQMQEQCQGQIERQKQYMISNGFLDQPYTGLPTVETKHSYSYHSYSYEDCTDTFKRLYCDGATLYHSSDCGDTCSSDCAAFDLTSATNGQYYCDPSDSSVYYKDEFLADGTVEYQAETHSLSEFTDDDGCYWASCGDSGEYVDHECYCDGIATTEEECSALSRK